MIYIKDWFLEKAITDGYVRDLFKVENEFGDVLVEKETEKAVLIKADIIDVGVVKFWCPKSCIYTDVEIQELRNEAEKRFCEGEKRYEKMLAFAKENGVVVRSKMRKETILNKIKQAGLVYEY